MLICAAAQVLCVPFAETVRANTRKLCISGTYGFVVGFVLFFSLIFFLLLVLKTPVSVCSGSANMRHACDSPGLDGCSLTVCVICHSYAHFELLLWFAPCSCETP